MMSRQSRLQNGGRRPGDWLRFLTGLVLLGLVVAVLASGYSPPGVLGEVLRHNQDNDIDASPLFYTEVEHMHELETGLAELKASDE
jgi:hypothetical protein